MRPLAVDELGDGLQVERIVGDCIFKVSIWMKKVRETQDGLRAYSLGLHCSVPSHFRKSICISSPAVQVS